MALLMVCAPVVLIRPPLITTLPPVFVVRLVSAAVLPTAPLNVVTPAVLTAKVCAPLSVLSNVIAPVPELVKVVAAPKVATSP